MSIFLAKHRRRSEDLGAASANGFVIGKERVTEIERRRRQFGPQPRTRLGRDIGEPSGNIGMPGEDDGRDPGADRRHRRTRVIAAIEKRRVLRSRHRLARRAQDCAEPARPGIDPGVGRAGKNDRPPRGRAQRCDSMRQRMDYEDWRAAARFASERRSRRLLRRSAPRNDSLLGVIAREAKQSPSGKRA